MTSQKLLPNYLKAFHATHTVQSHEIKISLGDWSVMFGHKYSLLASEQICPEPFVVSMCKAIKPLSSSGTAHPSWNSIKLTYRYKKEEEEKRLMFKTLNKGHLANGRLAQWQLYIFVCLKPLKLQGKNKYYGVRTLQKNVYIKISLHSKKPAMEKWLINDSVLQ